MIAVIFAAMVGAGILVANVPVSDEQKLIDENRISISFHAEKIDGATKVTRVTVIPDVSLKDCNGTDCEFAWGHESILTNNDRITTVLELDLKALECSVDKATLSGKCVQREVPLTDVQWEIKKISTMNSMEVLQ